MSFRKLIKHTVMLCYLLY